MKHIKLAIYFIGLGVSLGTSLVIYAHQTFATKEQVEELRTIMYRMDERIYDMHVKLMKHGD